jgi:hypothetical protein
MKRLTIIPLAVLALTPLTRATAQEQPSPLFSGGRIRLKYCYPVLEGQH